MTQYRLLSAAELLLGGAIVIGHNVFRILPNEVPILFVLGWISLRWRNDGWRTAGFSMPKSWPKTIGIALGAAAVLQLGSELVVGPLVSRFWPEPEHVSQAIASAAGGWKEALTMLAVVWTFAAFGEEMDYRGYLLTRGAEMFGQSRSSYLWAMVAVAIFFGFGHYYKGPVGVIDSSYSGLVLGGAYLLSGRNLWAPILGHGLSDTFALFVLFMGWAK
jgi:uncharacterized protein